MDGVEMLLHDVPVRRMKLHQGGHMLGEYLQGIDKRLFLLGLRAVNRGGVGKPPVCTDRATWHDGARFLCGIVTERNDPI